ncbi:MAG: 50S ribosomal protein L22 [Armatimonadota bacterium]|nr:50S ribosomal protein L22 [bacterium]
MQAIAKARFVRTSPRKARLVIDEIRGKDVRDALGILQFTPNFAARLIEKVLKSAVANAENNHHMDGENLKVSLAMVDGGPLMKRVRYAPMGRGYRMVKRLSHITIGVEETEPKPEKKRKRKEVARTAKPGAKAPKAAAKAHTKKAPKKEEQPASAVEEEKVVAAEVVEVVETSVAPEVTAAAEVETIVETEVVESKTAKSEGDSDAKGGE